MKKFICVFVSLVFVCFAFTGCKNQKPSGRVEKPSPDAIVASIGDEKITYARYAAMFESYLSYYQQFGYNPASDKTSLERFQDDMIDALTSDMITVYRAKNDNFSLSDDVSDRVIADAEKEIQTLREEFMSNAERDYNKDPSKSKEEYFDGYVSAAAEFYTGKALNFREYSEFYKNEMLNAALMEEYKKFVCADFAVSDSAVEEWYNEQLEADEKLYTENPGEYKQHAEYFEMNSGVEKDAYPPVFIPEGYSRIMEIVIVPEGEPDKEYNEKTKRKQEIYDECSLLMFNDALEGTNENAERIAELLEEYRKVNVECGSLYDKYSFDARRKAEEAYAELEKGEPFAQVMLKFTEDPVIIGGEGKKACEKFKTDGKLISLTHTCEYEDWSQTVKDIFGTLKNGEYSDVFPDEDGSFRIIYRAGDEKAGRIALEALYGSIQAIVKAESDEAAWKELMETWKDDKDLKIDMELVRSMGCELLVSEKSESGKDKA